MKPRPFKDVLAYWFSFVLKKSNGWIKNHALVLGAWASLYQLVFIPVLLVGGVASYFQVVAFLEKADLHFEFGSPRHVRFRIVNSSNVVADIPSYGFGIFDLDAKEPLEPLKIPWKYDSYVRKESAKGPWALLGKFEEEGHRYFGFARLSCRNCLQDRVYWVFSKLGNNPEAWYVEVGEGELNLWNPNALVKDPESYLSERFPEHRRMAVREVQW